MRLRSCLFAFPASLLLGAGVAPLVAQTDAEALRRIREEATARSEVMETARWLTDVYGPRLTGSPLDSMAGEWAMRQMRRWGLSNVHAEPFPFAKPSWMNERFHLQVTSPAPFPVIGMAGAWSRGTDSLIRAPAVIARIRSAADTVRLRGTLRGVAALLSAPTEGWALATTLPVVLTSALIDRMVNERKDWYVGTSLLTELSRPVAEAAPAGARLDGRTIMDFLQREGVALVLYNGGGVGGNFGVADAWPDRMPQVNVAQEHYNRIFRTLHGGTPVTLEFDIRNRISAGPATPFNVIGELPGTDRAEEIVMIGAHLDSWIGGTGATDNAAGVAVMMEAMRILRGTALPLRRTVRIALWNGEEQFNEGSGFYVTEHFGTARAPKREHRFLSAYFNLDEGAGAIRTIDSHGNAAAHPLLDAWVARLADDSLRIRHVTSLGNAASDVSSFVSAGLPGFYFVQDPLDYARGTHHTSQDVYDRLVPADLRHNAIVVAALVWMAANHAEPVPRGTRP